jgi:hypothetical protein
MKTIIFATFLLASMATFAQNIECVGTDSISEDSSYRLSFQLLEASNKEITVKLDESWGGGEELENDTILMKIQSRTQKKVLLKQIKSDLTGDARVQINFGKTGMTGKLKLDFAPSGLMKVEAHLDCEIIK